MTTMKTHPRVFPFCLKIRHLLAATTLSRAVGSPLPLCPSLVGLLRIPSRLLHPKKKNSASYSLLQLLCSVPAARCSTSIWP
ncbi:hypothetical protein B0H13DRAFT_2225476 [Mycena leptocephala]|nr:hypothetical protein B0H13DRAFT_2225476 [Mycena leptocephala]